MLWRNDMNRWIDLAQRCHKSLPQPMHMFVRAADRRDGRIIWQGQSALYGQYLRRQVARGLGDQADRDRIALFCRN